MRSKEQIKFILNEIDFNRIHLAMKFLDWKWHYSNGDKAVPSVSDLISIAEYCLNNVATSNDETATFSVGGFEAEKINNVLELRFILDKANPLSPILNTDVKNELARKA